ncbi:MAG: hypothetical protein F6J97_22785 [Leptolyngbya sp. SIO4C1]|nr:hypothetical protein [Leptolyngbya sp. SIO4C1]
MNIIQYQASALWHTVSEQDTAVTYRQAGAKTWKILQQAFALFLLLLLFSSAVILWIWGLGFHSGRSFRIWLETEQPPIEKLVYIIARIVAWPLEKAITWANQYVEKYLGWQSSLDFHFLEPGEDQKAISPSAQSDDDDES